MSIYTYKPKTRKGVQRRIEITKKTIESAMTIKNEHLRKQALRSRRRELAKLEEQLNEFGLVRRRIKL